MKNKFTNKKIPIKKLSTGAQLEINVITIEGNKPGPCVYLQSSVHGAEIQGNYVLYHLIKEFQKTAINGKIIIVPFANPYGIIQKSGPYTQGRFNPVTGNNYNRNYTPLFKSEENKIKLEQFIENNYQHTNFHQKFKNFLVGHIDSIIDQKKPYGLSDDFYLNIILQRLAAEADICLDLHTGPIACEYLYSPEKQEEDALNHFPFEFIINIPEEFAGAMDEAFFMNYVEANKILSKLGQKPLPNFSYTVELESEETINQSSKKLATKILHYLQSKNLFDSINLGKLPPVQKKSFYLKDYKTYYAPTGGLVEYLVLPGTEFKKGDILGKMISPNFEPHGFDEHEILAKENGWLINFQNSGNVHEGMELFQVAENVRLF